MYTNRNKLIIINMIEEKTRVNNNEYYREINKEPRRTYIINT